VIDNVMIKKAVMKKWVKRFIVPVFVLGLYSCATVDKRFSNPEDAVHPGMQVFLDYQASINSDSGFDDGVPLFFSEAGQKKIEASQGWNRLVYSSTFRALKNGSCEALSIIKQSPNRILISCKGPYFYSSPFGFSSEEKMHLRVYVRKSNQRWSIDTAGLTHTMDGGNSVPRSAGLKFPK
jgi:hypothetical protein